MELHKKIPEGSLRAAAGEKVYRRGVRYYKQGLVTSFDLYDNKVLARVVGSRNYKVSFEFTDEGMLKTSCDCPYDWGNVCKHVVAVALKFNDVIEREKKSPKKKKEQSWESVLTKDRESYEDENDSDDNSKVVFVIKPSSDVWEMEAKRLYVKKDGTFGRSLNMDSFSYAEDYKAYGVTSSEQIVMQYMSSIGYTFNHSAGFRYGSDFGSLLKLLKDSKIYINYKYEKPLRFRENNKLTYHLDKSGKDYAFSLKLSKENGETIAVDSSIKLLTIKPVHLLSKDNIIYQVESKLVPRHILPFTRQDEVLPVKKSEVAAFIKKVYTDIRTTGTEFIIPEDLRIVEISEINGKGLYLLEEDGELLVKPEFYYGEERFTVAALPFNESFAVEYNDKNYLVRRQKSVENGMIALLQQHKLQYDSDGRFRIKGKKNPIDWMFETLPIFSDAGFNIFGEDKLDKLKIKRSSAKIISHVSSGQDWFNLKVEIDFDGSRVSYFDVAKALRKKRKYFQLNDGAYVQIDDAIIEKLGFISSFATRDSKKKSLQFSPNQALLLNEILENTDKSKVDKGFKERLKKLKSFKKVEPAKLSKKFKGKLRPYQKAGLDWLTFLRDYNFGGCLADDMGLGKTVQALALLQNEKDDKQGTSLIIAPTSVISNWALEAARFTPNLKVNLHYGKDRNKKAEEFSKYDLVLTSYALMWRDYDMFNSFSFNYLILDESQKIKNPNSLTAKAARNMQVRHRLVMTGTPIENNLNELWSQFQFINPGMLGNNKSFHKNFAKSIEKYGDQDKAEQLKRVIYPFVLRRTKDVVLKELPPKVENVVFCEMDEHHENAYKQWRDYYREEILAAIESEGMAKSKLKILEGLTKLRQVSIHPKLVDKGYVKTSGKTEVLWDLLEEIRREGHKVLVFSQFVKALTLIRKRLDDDGVQYCYLDGSTKNRQDIVDQFQTDDDLKIFLISLKAGGLGLNLTAADYVIHIDPWWNPAVENQATDRAHRMGQKKKVFVYKLITKDTVEEKILRLQERKKDLASELISSDGAFFKNISSGDIKTLFS